MFIIKNEGLSKLMRKKLEETGRSETESQIKRVLIVDACIVLYLRPSGEFI